MPKRKLLAGKVAATGSVPVTPLIPYNLASSAFTNVDGESNICREVTAAHEGDVGEELQRLGAHRRPQRVRARTGKTAASCVSSSSSVQRVSSVKKVCKAVGARGDDNNRLRVCCEAVCGG